MDVYNFLSTGNDINNILLKDQDIIIIRPYDLRVHLTGEVKKPGLFELTKGESIQDLITYAGGMTGQAYSSRITVIRNAERQRTVHSILKPEYRLFELRNGDQLHVGEILDTYDNRLRISGAVDRPGIYSFSEGMKLSDLIGEADGLKKDAYLQKGLLVREKDDKTMEYLDFDLEMIKKYDSLDIQLQPEDSIRIASIFDLKEKDSVSIDGEVINPKKVSFQEKLTLGKLLLMAGGFKKSAGGSFIEISRMVNSDTISSPNLTSKIFSFPIDFDLRIEAEIEAFLLSPGDKVFVRKASGYAHSKSVLVRGEINFPGSYRTKTVDERISDIIRRAGGVREAAFVEGAVVYRYRNDFEREKDTLYLASDFEERVQISLDLGKILENPGGVADLILRERDEIFIPEQPGTVSVSGAVFHTSITPYDPSMKLMDYVDKAGGFTKGALKSKAFVVYYNGDAAKTRSILGMRRYPTIKSGSEIQIPTKMKKERGLAIQNISSISTAALGFAVLIDRIFR